MNELAPEKVSEVTLLFQAGLSVRKVALSAGVAVMTARRYRKMFEICPQCACGKPVTHPGWCRSRYEQSPGRQVFMQRWHGAPIPAFFQMSAASGAIGESMKTTTREDTKPGFCECGCGERTTRTKYDDAARGMKAGDFSRFVRGHHHNVIRRTKPDWGRQSRRKRELNALRAAVLDGRDVSSHFNSASALSIFLLSVLNDRLLFWRGFERQDHPRETYEEFIERKRLSAGKRAASKKWVKSIQRNRFFALAGAAAEIAKESCKH